MFVFYTGSLLLFAGGGGGGFTQFYNNWFNIPGFELWKFINLAIFIAVMVYLLRKPLTEAFKAKREQIRADLIRAEAEKQAALKNLDTIEAKLAGLGAEKAGILADAETEAANEKRRLAEQTDADIARMGKQAEQDLARLLGQTRAELRRFSAEESIRRAEQQLRAKIDDATDAQLVRAGMKEIGGLSQNV